MCKWITLNHLKNKRKSKPKKKRGKEKVPSYATYVLQEAAALPQAVVQV
jgi:hypothetical protein